LLGFKQELETFTKPMVMNNFTMYLIQRIVPDLAIVDVEFNPKDAFVTHTTFSLRRCYLFTPFLDGWQHVMLCQLEAFASETRTLFVMSQQVPNWELKAESFSYYGHTLSTPGQSPYGSI
jgi:hypothetical protein